MNISVIGTGYVGLVTGVCLAEIGHVITCVDVDETKIEKLRRGISPIYEPGLEELLVRNMNCGRLSFTSNHEEGFSSAEAIFIAVGTPAREDGTANLAYIEQAAKDIARYLSPGSIIVTKSTVPVGTNDFVKKVILENLNRDCPFFIASNPEFLREGSAVHDTFHGDRIVIGYEEPHVGALLEQVFQPFGVPIYHTNIRSAELIKYSSNAFLATKISFINEIANLCEKLGADIEEVAEGMGLDKRIGSTFLKAGIGYGGSCFPKDTNALVQIAGNYEHNFKLLRSVIEVNRKQQKLLIDKAKARFSSLNNLRVAILGLAFKPHTDDMREAASILVTNELIKEGANVIAYDPIAKDNAKLCLNPAVNYVDSVEEALIGADCAFILTEWPEIKELNLRAYKNLMKEAVVFDGRNCYDLKTVEAVGLEYHSIGRSSVVQHELIEI